MFRFALALLLLPCWPAGAHDHKHPELDQWYGSLTKPGSHGYEGGGVSCCSMTDCHPTDAETRGDEWWARLGERRGDDWDLGEWVRVPPEAIIPNKTNPTGEAVICHPLVRGPDGGVDAKRTPIWCFVLGAGA